MIASWQQCGCHGWEMAQFKSCRAASRRTASHMLSYVLLSSHHLFILLSSHRQHRRGNSTICHLIITLAYFAYVYFGSFIWCEDETEAEAGSSLNGDGLNFAAVLLGGKWLWWWVWRLVLLVRRRREECLFVLWGASYFKKIAMTYSIIPRECEWWW